MPVITLTSDYGTRDHYLASVKGRLLQGFPGVTIIDISHDVSKFDLLEASFLLRASWQHFPEKTIHIVSVRGAVSDSSPPIVLQCKGHFFIGVDNGIFSLVLGEEPIDFIVKLTQPEVKSFPALELFTTAAIRLCEGSDITTLGENIEDIDRKKTLEAFADQDSITGRVIFVDSYENAILNVSKTLFQEVGKNRNFYISMRTSRKQNDFGPAENALSTISDTYSDVPEGEMLALFNSSSLLEIAINRGNAAGLLGLKTGEIIRIHFV